VNLCSVMAVAHGTVAATILFVLFIFSEPCY
jgi:hypothetical protein